MTLLSKPSGTLKQAASRPAPGIDYAEVQRALKTAVQAGDLIELRALESRKRTVSGYYDDFTKLIRDLPAIDALRPEGIYVTLNPIGNRDLRALTYNHFNIFVKNATPDVDIACRRWLPLDFDPFRSPKKISSTDQEHLLAFERARAARIKLSALGWGEPIFADSGNGAHLLYKIDLPNDDAARDLVQQVLRSAASEFGDSLVEFDVSNFNAARIWKLYGTVARKGDNLAERPHRVARIITLVSK